MGSPRDKLRTHNLGHCGAPKGCVLLVAMGVWLAAISDGTAQLTDNLLSLSIGELVRLDCELGEREMFPQTIIYPL